MKSHDAGSKRMRWNKPLWIGLALILFAALSFGWAILVAMAMTAAPPDSAEPPSMYVLLLGGIPAGLIGAGCIVVGVICAFRSR